MGYIHNIFEIMLQAGMSVVLSEGREFETPPG